MVRARLEDGAKNWFTNLIPDWLHEDYRNNTEIFTRCIIGISSGIVLLVTLYVGYRVNIRSAPGFVKTQFGLIAVCNLAGVIFSVSMLEVFNGDISIYDNPVNYMY